MGKYLYYRVTASVEGKTHVSRSYSREFEILLKQNEMVFCNDNTGIKEFTASIKLKPNARPVYQKCRSVPYSLLEKVEEAYDKLVKAEILYPVSNSQWASPVVHVQKSDGSVGVCCDYKAVNELFQDDGYKLPNISEMFAKITHKGVEPKVYSVLDLSDAFNQLYLGGESAEYLTLNTCKGLMGIKRLCYGVKTTPAQFQAAMDKILVGIDGVFCYIDDILIISNTVEQHLKILKAVFERLVKYNVNLNKMKCKFFQEVQYLGHQLCAEGIRPLQNKVEAIVGAPRPKGVSELKSFLSTINFYGKFIPNLFAQLHPLHELLHRDASWSWNPECEKAFQRTKEMLVGDKVLVHYDSLKPVVPSVDASP